MKKESFSPEFISMVKRYYDEAMSQHITDEVQQVTMYQFCGRYEENLPWRVGPFQKEKGMDFRLRKQWKDPLNIGWSSGFLFNPSLIPHEGKLYMFYRAAPRKEVICSRIGLAIYDEKTGWTDYKDNPIIYPTSDYEAATVEDPKVYRAENKYFMFYNGAWTPSEDEKKSVGAENISLAVDICCAVSDDLFHWEKLGRVVPYNISKYWAKGAVIPKDKDGNAVKINGKYLMFISEGCGGLQYVGESADMLNWKFIPRKYLDISSMGTMCEVAAAIPLDGGGLVLDFLFQDKEGKLTAGQALYSQSEPFTQKRLAVGGCLSWGGVIQYRGKWAVAQGWDARNGDNECYIYTAEVRR